MSIEGEFTGSLTRLRTITIQFISLDGARRLLPNLPWTQLLELNAGVRWIGKTAFSDNLKVDPDWWNSYVVFAHFIESYQEPIKKGTLQIFFEIDIGDGKISAPPECAAARSRSYGWP